jgi:hypothetical protein
MFRSFRVCGFVEGSALTAPNGRIVVRMALLSAIEIAPHRARIAHPYYRACVNFMHVAGLRRKDLSLRCGSSP